MNPTTSPQGFVYVIHATGTNRIKIGYSKTPEKRLKGLQTGSPHKLAILAQWPGSRAAERQAQGVLQEYRGEGEWFTVPPCIAFKIWQAVQEAQARRRTLLPKKRRKEPGRYYVDAVKPSVGMRAFRLRRRESNGHRSVEYLRYVTEDVFQLIRQDNYPAFTRQVAALANHTRNNQPPALADQDAA